MSTKSYSTTTTRITNTPKTIALQDDAILAEGGSTINILDEGAISKALSFADSTFDRASDTTDKTLEMAGIFSSNERQNMANTMKFVEASFMKAGNMMNDALHYKASEQAERNKAKEGERALMGDIMSDVDGGEQNIIFYAGIVGGVFVLMKMFKVF